MNNRIDASLLGKTLISNSGDLYRVEAIKNYYDVSIVFPETGFEMKARLDHVRDGRVRDRLKPDMFGVGYLGYGNYKGHCKQKTLWGGIMQRCYSEKYHQKKPTYKECTVSDFFKNYTNFYEWCNNQIGFGNPDWDIDKDLLSKESKIYSEDTCVFLPKEINVAIVGSKSFRGENLIGVRKVVGYDRYQVRINRYGKAKSLGYFCNEIEAFNAYKQAKESYLKELAVKWKDQIDPRAYEALMKYEVNIND